MGTRAAIALGLLLLCAISIVRLERPPPVVAATAPDTVFSAERAMRHVEAIAVRPHAIGMPDHDRVRDYVAGQLTALGLRPQIQHTTAVGTVYRAAGRVENILAFLPGSSGSRKAVLLMAHYDGVEAGPAAGDDGAGSAAMLETVRALRARKTPLAHDIIALFTDGEEAGLMGAAAFVRERPWAKDIAVVLNFEARGTSGRSLMFETGPGDLDAVRVLSTVGDVTAGSVFTTIYRTQPNDTDLSELAALGTPALNFAFTDGVERYHTSHDDVARLNPGSVQHHGNQMLALAKAFASDTLPRPLTGDAVFFDLPIVGLVVYPIGLSLPIAVVALILVVIVAVRVGRGVVVGVVVTLLAVATSALVAWGASSLLGGLHAHLAWGGAPQWRGLYASAIAMAVIAVTASCYALAKRWADGRGLHAGTLVVWAILSVATGAMAPGVSYLFTWPVLFAAAAAIGSPRALDALDMPARPARTARWRFVADWVAAAVTLLLLVGFVYGVTVVLLGVAGAGAIVLGALTSFIVLLVAPLLARVAGEVKWAGAQWAAGAALVLAVVGAVTVRSSAEHPIPTELVYAENADSTDAWFGAFDNATDTWTRSVVATTKAPPAWLARTSLGGRGLIGRRVSRAPLGAPMATLLRDTTIGDGQTRRVVLRVTAPAGTTTLLLRARDTRVLASSIDGRVVDTTRYRTHAREWNMRYWAVPDTGAIIALSMPAGAPLDLELTARIPGIPHVDGLSVPTRPPQVVPAQVGDVSLVYRRLVIVGGLTRP